MEKKSFGVLVEGTYLTEDGVTQVEPIYPWASREEAEQQAKSCVLSWCTWWVVEKVEA